MGGVHGRGPPQGDPKAVVEAEHRFRQAGFATAADHVGGAGAKALDVLRQVEGLGQQGIGGDRAVRLAQLGQGEGGGQAAGVPDLDAIGEHHHLHAAVAGVVAVGDGVHNRFADHLRWNLVGGGGLAGGRAGADCEVEASEHEIHGLIHQVEHRALEHLIGGDRLGYGRGVEVGGFELTAEQEALGLAAEEQHGGVHGLAVNQKVEVGEQLVGGGVGRQGEAAHLAGPLDEPGDAVVVEVGQGGVGAGGGVEGAAADQLLVFEPLHQGGIEAGDQLGGGGEAAAHQRGLGLADQGEHARIAAGVIGGLEKDQAGFAALAGALKLPLGGPDPFGVDTAVFTAEQAHIESAAVDVLEVEVIGAAVAGGQVFEQHRLEEAPQQRIPLQEVAKRQPFGGELLLHAAEEDLLEVHGYKRLTSHQPPGEVFFGAGFRYASVLQNTRCRSLQPVFQGSVWSPESRQATGTSPQKHWLPEILSSELDYYWRLRKASTEIDWLTGRRAQKPRKSVAAKRL